MRRRKSKNEVLSPCVFFVTKVPQHGGVTSVHVCGDIYQSIFCWRAVNTPPVSRRNTHSSTECIVKTLVISPEKNTLFTVN